jgi:hypothetical protein
MKIEKISSFISNLSAFKVNFVVVNYMGCQLCIISEDCPKLWSFCENFGFAYKGFISEK